MYVLCCLADPIMKFLQPMVAFMTPLAHLRQLYGEWIIAHSNHPDFQSVNSKMVTLYPKRDIVISHLQYIGPFLCSFEKSGEFEIFCKDDVCNLEEDIICDIRIRWKEEKHYLDAVLGIGVREVIREFYSQSMDHEAHLSLHIFEKNNLYLSNGVNHHLHLIRNIQQNRPSVETPLSTFIFSQILGSLLIKILHHHFKDFL